MTIEEAIKTIEIAIAEVEWEYPMEYVIAFEMAISALEKQISKKPNGIYDENAEEKRIEDFEGVNDDANV